MRCFRCKAPIIGDGWYWHGVYYCDRCWYGITWEARMIKKGGEKRE